MTTKQSVSVKDIRNHLRTTTLGRIIEVLETTTSTHEHMQLLHTYKTAKPNSSLGALKDGYTILARGQSSKLFVSSTDNGIYMSMFMATSPTFGDPILLTQLVCVAICHAVEKLFPSLTLHLRWINDIILKGRRLGIVLVDNVETGRALDSCITSVYLNTGVLNQNVASFAASLAQYISPTRLNPSVISAEILNQIEDTLHDYTHVGASSMLAEYRRRSKQ